MSLSNNSDEDPIPFQCDTSYDPRIELLKYIIQVSYLLMNIFLNVLILRATVFKKNNGSRDNSFFFIYAADLIVGIYMCFSEIFVNRLFIYIIPLCPILSPYFFTPSIFLKSYFTLTHYSQGIKTISQVFLSFNRMTCVIFPTNHKSFWKRIQATIMILLFVLPLGIIWNVIISRVYTNPSAGGFSVNYIKKVTWASLSRLHLIYFIVSFALIIFFSGTTLYALLFLKKRLKSAENSITMSTMVISIQFGLLTVLQIYFAFFSSTTSIWRPILLRVLDFTYDFLNLSTSIIFIACNRQLRNKLIKWKNENSNSEVTRRSTNTSSLNKVLSSPIWTVPATL